MTGTHKGPLLVEAVAETTRLEAARLAEGDRNLTREIVRSAHHDGLISHVDGVWRHTGPLTAATAVRDLVEHRLAGLSALEREAVEVLAVAERLELALAAGLVGESTLERLETAGIVEVLESGSRVEVRLRSETVAEVTRRELPRIRRRTISKRLAGELDVTPCRRADDLARLATWRLEGGDAPDPEGLLRAAAAARARLDFTTEERLARAAMQRRDSWRSRVALARSLTAQGATADAERTLAQAADLDLDDRRRAHVAIARSENHHRRGEIDAAIKTLEILRPEVADTEVGIEVAARLALLRADHGDLDGCVAATTVIADTTPFEPRVGAVRSLALAQAHVAQGELEEALTETERGLADALLARAEVPLVELRLRLALARTLVLLGRLHDAEELARAALAEAVEDRSEDRAAVARLTLGLVLIERGRPAEAARQLADACGRLRERDPLALLATCLAARAYAAAILGDIGAAEKLLEEAASGPSVPGQTSAGWITRARCWLAIERGDFAAALEVGVDAATAQWPLRLGARVAHDLARAGRAEAADHLAELATDMPSDFVTVMAAHAVALADGDAEQLEQAAEAFLDAGAELAAAEAFGQAATVHHMRGRTRRAQLAAIRAAGLAERCDDVATPSLAGLFYPLTMREREVAHLATRGLSNREVAERLTLSVRTVENHLYRAYAKLGISSRAELAAVLNGPRPARDAMDPDD